ncbi:hypothetical protein WCLP8_2270004 [uncultured Gammaproteobacteria bacterium]
MWGLAEKFGYPVKSALVKAAVLGLAEIKAMEPRTDSPELYERLEVGDPTRTSALLVSARDQAGQVIAELVVGKTKSYASSILPAEIYVRRPSEARAWLAAGRLEARNDPLSWIERTLPGVEGERVREVTITQAAGPVLRLIRSEAGKPDFTVDQLPAGKKIMTEVLVNDVGNAVARLSVEDVRRAEGLDFTLGGTARFVTFDGLTVTVRVIKLDGKNWLSLEAAAGAAAEVDDKTRAAVVGQAEAINAVAGGWAFQVAQYQAKPLWTRLEDLLAKEGEPASGK